jgi:DNA-binding transcriptional LysR family regulator
LEQLAKRLTSGWEAEIRLVVDGAMSSEFLFAALREFSDTCTQTQIQLREVILSGAEEALLNDSADIAICAWVPPNFLGNPLTATEFVAVAHHTHALNHTDAEISASDLTKHRQVVISDSGTASKRDFGWLGAEQRWTFTHMSTAVAAIKSGLCFGWVPRHRIEAELTSGELKVLPLREGARYFAPLYLVRGIGRDGPATQKLMQLFSAHAKRCNAPYAELKQ